MLDVHGRIVVRSQPGRSLRCLILSGLASLALAAPLTAPGRTGTIAEARVYFDDVRSLRQLGELAGRLDVCTWVKDELGGYLLVDADSIQLEQVRAAGLLVDVTYPDIRQKFYQMTGVRPGDLVGGRDFGYYLNWDEVRDTLQKLAAAYPAICSTFSLGPTPEGRPLLCLKISDNPGTTEGEPACFFNGATHAREPLSTHCCVAFASRLLSEYGTDSAATWLVDNREIYVVPVMNPDGYAYNSDSGGDLSNWRKNRRSPVPPEIGVDLNRNYGYKWGYDYWGSSGRPEDETYRGPAPFSEPETQMVRDFLAQCRPHDCLDLHSFGRYNMYPWGYASALPPDQAVLRQVVDTFQANNHYPRSLSGQVYSTIYPCNGMSVDWEYSDTAGKFVTYAFTCELGITDFWYGWLDSVYIRNECDLNIPNLYFLTRVAGTYLEGSSATVDDSATGNWTGRLDPGEESGIWFKVRNRAIHPLDSGYAITARLVPLDPGIRVLDSTASFANVPRAGCTDNHAAQFRVRAADNLTPGALLRLRLEVTFSDAGCTCTQPLYFAIRAGAEPIANTGVRPDRQQYRRPNNLDHATVDAPAQLYPARLVAAPNPARNHVTLSTTPLAAAGHLDVFLTNGSRVASFDITCPYSWDCSRLRAGVYFCRLAAGGNYVTTRVNVIR